MLPLGYKHVAIYTYIQYSLRKGPGRVGIDDFYRRSYDLAFIGRLVL